MKKYETVLIFTADLSESKIVGVVKKMEEYLASKGAANITSSTWGKKQLAYSMSGSKYGVYWVINFESDNGDLVGEFNSQLRLNDSLLRYQTHLLSDKRRKFQGNPRRIKKVVDLEEIVAIDDGLEDILEEVKE
ncbi:MAG TPA: 30S ribosomal protein S6 [Oligoflexia bacterium]|nr:30S ribosomal protein S6 [Oligoflexia bacterium]HMP26741.1 30S ribosomal protein S6 [Oligoflexia bacterium]